MDPDGTTGRSSPVQYKNMRLTKATKRVKTGLSVRAQANKSNREQAKVQKTEQQN